MIGSTVFRGVCLFAAAAAFAASAVTTALAPSAPFAGVAPPALFASLPTLIDLIAGARLGIWYATSISSTTGDSRPPVADIVSRYCMKRAGGLVTCTKDVAGASSLQFDHPVLSGSCTFPLRVAIVSPVSFGSDPRRWILPNRMICDASSTGLVNVPVSANPLLIDAIPPTFAIPRSTRPSFVESIDSTCCGSTFASTTVSSAAGSTW